MSGYGPNAKRRPEDDGWEEVPVDEADHLASPETDGWEEVPVEEEADPDKEGGAAGRLLDAAAAGLSNGVTFGFLDEAGGAVGALVRKAQGEKRDFADIYAEERDRNREQLQSYKEDPVAKYAYHGGEFAGMMIPSVPLFKGAGLVGAALRGGVSGAAYGVGASNADLTEGDHLEQFAGDVGKNAMFGAAAGAGAHAVHRAVRAAEPAITKTIEQGEEALAHGLGNLATPEGARRAVGASGMGRLIGSQVGGGVGSAIGGPVGYAVGSAAVPAAQTIAAKGIQKVAGRAASRLDRKLAEREMRRGVGVLTAENPMHAVKTPGGNSALEAELKASGMKYEPVTGKYGEGPLEHAFMVKGGDPNKLMDMSHRYGQDGLLLSRNGQNAMVKTNGPEMGSGNLGEGISTFRKPPPDFYSTAKGASGSPLNFRANLNFDKQVPNVMARLQESAMQALGEKQGIPRQHLQAAAAALAYVSQNIKNPYYAKQAMDRIIENPQHAQQYMDAMTQVHQNPDFY